MRRIVVFAALAGGLALAGPGAGAAELIQNGGFESGLTGWTVATQPSPNPGGWLPGVAVIATVPEPASLWGGLGAVAITLVFLRRRSRR